MELGVWIPGGKAPSLRLDATTIDALLAFDARLTDSWALVGAGGFRLDHSKQAMPDDRTLSQADWVVLGLSSWNAALARLGSELKLGRTRSFVEWTWDVFVGSTAPAIMKSPMYAAIGTRIDLDRRGALVLNLSARALLSERPRVDVQGPAIPFPPRYEVWTALSYQFGGHPKPAAPPPGTDENQTAKTEVTPEPSAQASEGQPEGTTAESTPASGASTVAAAAATPEVQQASGQLRFLVRDHETGEPLEANIVVVPVGSGATPSEYKSGADGRLEIDLPPGRYEVTVKLYRWRKQVKTVEIEDESVTLIDAALHARSKKR
ncbi:MAG: hypothetical protein QM778_14530 [Myxococcales bacterium]